MSADAEVRAAAYLREQAEITRKRALILRLLAAPAAPFVALVARYQPIRDYQQEQRRNGREADQPKDNGVTVN
jgi:hypothetical protein